MTAFGLLLLALALAPASALYAQNLALTPSDATAGPGQTVQFSVQATDLSNADVTWSAAGVKGGSSKAGKITPAGLYKAPARPPAQNPVKITATSKVDPNISASAYVNILSPGPKVLAVSPNPLPAGAFTVTIKGSGFKSGATVFDTYEGIPVQLTTMSVTSRTITASGRQEVASSALFSVKNPGSVSSNSIKVPVSYTLTVVNGTGSGSYAAGKAVKIKANAPPAGQTFLNWTGATVSNPNKASTTLTMPAAATTVTANYSAPATTYTLTVVNGTGSGSYAAGAVVTIKANAPPAGQTFLNWTGATVSDPNQATTTLTMPAAATTVTANYSAPVSSIPYPVSTHPRLWVTVNDLPRLRSWAAGDNPIYQQGMLPLLNEAVSIYETQFFPNGSANPDYPDPGDVQGYTGYLTEQYGAVLAFNSLIDPDPAARIRYAQYARNLLMHAMNQAVLGHLADAPFRDPMFAVYNRANGSGEQWPLIADWIYDAVDANGSPILTAVDKATIRQVFMMWANDCLNASTTGGDHPSPVGVMNDPELLPDGKPYRMAANNYYLGHARLLTMMALCIDPEDDPPVNAGAPDSQTGNSLRSYILNATGAWLYQEFAMFGDPSAVAGAYGLPSSGFGLASGGLPPEGMLYGHSYAYILGQLLALQTAGFNNASYSGPQIQLIGAPLWDRYVTGYISSLTPTAKTFPGQSWMGPVYQYGSYGDLLRLWVTPDFMQPFALLALLDQQNGKTDHASAARWFAVNATEGGSNALLTRITSPWSYGSTNAILYYLLLDPAASAAPDPRPSFPAVFYDAPAGRIVAHSDWGPNGAMFDYRASWISINHQLGDGGQFELYRNGEWLTKEMSNYDNNCLGMTTKYHNTLALQNWCPNGTPDLQWYEAGEWANGSQWMEGLDFGDPSTVTSNGSNYVYAASDLTNLFNRFINIWSPDTGANDILQATRSILWLKNDYIVVYDRATSLHSGLFKRFNLSLVNSPAIVGATSIETLASGQQLFIQTLLPRNPVITADFAVDDLNPVAQLEPTQYILTVEDPAKPTDVRFLHVLQGADAGAAMVPAGYLQNVSGATFDGAAFGSAAAYFPVNAAGTFTGTTLPAPSGVNTLFVTGLAASASYGVSIQPAAGGKVINITPGGAGALTDEAGVLKLTF